MALDVKYSRFPTFLHIISEVDYLSHVRLVASTSAGRRVLRARPFSM